MGTIDSAQVKALMEWLLEHYTGKTAERRRTILSRAARYWGAVECRLVESKGKLSARQFFLLLEEVVVDEMRKSRLDLLARAKFAADGEQITETRLVLDDDTEEEQQVTQFLDMAGDGLIEVS